jgi:hypothetical protein
MATVDLRPEIWRTPEDLVRFGLERSRVLMMNEAHDGLRRCRRTRVIGRRILPVAKAMGVQRLSMEALGPPGAWFQACFVKAGYLAQPEMKEFIQAARELGLRLSGYEANPRRAPKELHSDTLSLAYTNWREEEQARNLSELLGSLRGEEKLLVWCGNGHLLKEAVGDWVPMGVHFRRITGLEAFALDQTVTVDWDQGEHRGRHLLPRARPRLEALGGTAGFLRGEGPLGFPSGVDAYLLSLENALE